MKLQETTTQECVEIPKSSLGGIFGLTEEKCFDIVIPAQIVSNVLAGGGTQKHYILEDDLPENLFNNPKHERTQEFLSKVLTH